MRNKHRRPLFVLAFMAFLLAFNCIRLMDKYPVRPIVAVSLFAFGMLVGILIYTSVRMAKGKDGEEKNG
jgi:hypothetical protein